MLAAEEQRLQGELQESEELFLHDVHGIAGGAAEKIILVKQIDHLRNQINLKSRNEAELLSRVRALEVETVRIRLGEEREHDLMRQIREHELEHEREKERIKLSEQHENALTRRIRELESESESEKERNRLCEEREQALMRQIRELESEIEREKQEQGLRIEQVQQESNSKVREFDCEGHLSQS